MQLADLDTLKQSSRLVHYCATPLLFDPGFRQQIQADQQSKLEGKVKEGERETPFVIPFPPQGLRGWLIRGFLFSQIELIE